MKLPGSLWIVKVTELKTNETKIMQMAHEDTQAAKDYAKQFLANNVVVGIQLVSVIYQIDE